MIPELEGQFGDQMGDGDEAMMMGMGNNDENMGLMEDQRAVNIQHIAGVVEQQDLLRLRKLIFRATKGKSFMHVKEYESDEP